MCPPDFYGIEYEINPWMSRSRASDRPTAVAQWNALATILRGLGVQVEIMTPQPGLPDLVFTANAGLIYRDTFYSARFRHSERARESPVFEAWFAEHGFPVEHLPEGMYHEGAGDALFCGDSLFAGCPQLTAALTERGYTVTATPLDEFLKAGGSAKCLTLRLDGEEAAGWKTTRIG